MKTDNQKDYIQLAINEGVPQHTATALHDYIVDHIETGGFLKAYLSNDLMGALNKADSQNLIAFVNIGIFLYNNAPITCWRSPEIVEKWISMED